MRPADTWKDYELLDATDGNRLERWGETILIRPDPQVVWKTPKQSPLWAKADAVYHRSNQGGGEWEYKRRLPEKWKISCGEGEDKLTLIVSPTGFKHTGVFPEQAVNWAWYAKKIRAAGRPVNVLNLMVYKFRDLWRTDDFGIDWNLLWTEQQGTLTPELRSLLESIRPIGRVMYMAALLFAALGAMEAWRRRLAPNAMILVCMFFFLGTALSHMLLETQVRYHYNMIPFLILLAAWTVRSWSKTAAEKEDVRVIYVDRPENAEEKKDNIHFDMAKAIAEGHIHVSVTENVARTEEASKMEDSAKSSVENT